jgi:DNA-binding transcriptional LysR family regulator
MLSGDCRDAGFASLGSMLTQIRSFLAVVEEGSLHRAAARLSMSQSALSRQMQALEHELGDRLMERTSTGVELTPGGRLLAAKMGVVLAGYDRTMMEVRRLMRGESDRLRIGFLASAAREYLELPLKRVRQAQPKTVLKLLDLSPGEQITALRAGEIDVGLTDESAGLLARDFYTRKLAEMPSFAALHAQHPLAGEKQVRLAQLKHDVFVSGSEQEVPGITRRIKAYCWKYGKFRPRFIGPAQSLAETFEIIANENAVSILPAFMRHHVVPGVVILPLADPEVTSQIMVVWQRGKKSAALRTLLDSLFDNK